MEKRTVSNLKHCYKTVSTKDSLLLWNSLYQRQSAAMKHSLPKTVCCYETFSTKDSLLLWNILYQRQSAATKHSLPKTVCCYERVPKTVCCYERVPKTVCCYERVPKTVCCYERVSTKDSLLLMCYETLSTKDSQLNVNENSIKPKTLLQNILYKRQSAKWKREQCQTWNTRESRDVSWRVLCHGNPCELSANLGKPVTQASKHLNQSINLEKTKCNYFFWILYFMACLLE